MDRARIKLIHRQQGSVLIAVAGAVLIIFLAVAARWAMSGAERRLGQQTGVAATLDKIDVALLNYVMQNKRLPCPADGTIAITGVNAGVQTVTCAAAAQTNGVVPWVTLGLAENDARDPWNGRITYRVDPALTAAGSMNSTGCPLSPVTCSNNFLQGKGLDVWDGIAPWAARQNDRTSTTGAAYVVISHGATGAGALNVGGVLQPGSIGAIAIVPTPTGPPFTQPAGTNELPNMNGQPLVMPATLSSTYRNASLDTSRGMSNFDDFIHAPTLSNVLVKANLGPRAP